MTAASAFAHQTTLREDMHVHSTFSDGAATVAENLAHAVDLGLTRFCCVDHVRTATNWVPDFVATVREAAQGLPLDVRVGIEAKLLDRRGRLDVPARRAGVDYIFIADHQVPLADGPHHPANVYARLAAGHLPKELVVESLVDATVGAMLDHPGSVIAHLFSVLPKIGLSEADVPGEAIGRLVAAAVRSGATLEVSERWRCPSLRVAVAFRDAGVPVVLSTDSHKMSTIGRYTYGAHVLQGLQGA